MLGPGLGRTPGAQELVRELVQRIDVPLVIDADGLNALAGRLDELRHRRWPTVLTPHAGELGRLLEVDSAEVDARAPAPRARRRGALEGARRAQGRRHARRRAVGRASRSRPAARPRSRPPGTGDVLAGVTGAMLAKGLSPAHAACAAVYAHLRAGQLAAAPHGPDGVIASDVIAALPAALSA